MCTCLPSMYGCKTLINYTFRIVKGERKRAGRQLFYIVPVRYLHICIPICTSYAQSRLCKRRGARVPAFIPSLPVPFRRFIHTAIVISHCFNCKCTSSVSLDFHPDAHIHLSIPTISPSAGGLLFYSPTLLHSSHKIPIVHNPISNPKTTPTPNPQKPSSFSSSSKSNISKRQVSTYPSHSTTPPFQLHRSQSNSTAPPR